MYSISNAADSASEEAALIEQDDNFGGSVLMLDAREGDNTQPAATVAAFRSSSSAGTTAALSSVIRYNEIYAKSEIDTNQVLHQVCAKYHEYRMHKGTTVRTVSKDKSDASRLRMVIAWLTAVATDEQKAALSLEEPPNLTRNCIDLQEAFRMRFNAAELSLLGKNVSSRTLTAGAIERRITTLENKLTGFRDLIRKKQVNGEF